MRECVFHSLSLGSCPRSGDLLPIALPRARCWKLVLQLQAQMAETSKLSLLQGPPDQHLVMVAAQGYMPPGLS